MWEAFISGLDGLLAGFRALTWQNAFMMSIGGVLLFLGIKKNCEPLLLVPIGFGAILVNIPVANLMGETGLLRHFYDAGVMTEVFPCLIFIGIGAMTDFEPLLQRPRILLLGAAGQFGIFLTLALALILGFSKNEAVAIGIIGACDGPTAIFVTARYASHLLGPVSVAAYSYMSLVPIIQPPIMRLLTTRRERTIKMDYPEKTVSKTVKILFPIIVTLVTCIVAPMGTALMGMIMLGNLMKESGVVSRLTKASENEIANVVTLLLGLSIGATMEGTKFLNVQTVLILFLGFIAICFDTVAGVLFGKLMCFFTKGKINPLIGAAGISAYPMAARVVQLEGRKYDTNNWLLMHAMGANTGGQVGSVMTAAIMLSVLNGLGLI
ncbi:MAG: sodium ion-translocating decarboxylase subunit beta [Spirochaetales bacterium]|nr:sodium ion-translocating decarboxylase subunit beta [Spirochaetales bacterium]